MDLAVVHGRFLAPVEALPTPDLSRLLPVRYLPPSPVQLLPRSGLVPRQVVATVLVAPECIPVEN